MNKPDETQLWETQTWEERVKLLVELVLYHEEQAERYNAKLRDMAPGLEKEKPAEIDAAEAEVLKVLGGWKSEKLPGLKDFFELMPSYTVAQTSGAIARLDEAGTIRLKRGPRGYGYCLSESVEEHILRLLDTTPGEFLRRVGIDAKLPQFGPLEVTEALDRLEAAGRIQRHGKAGDRWTLSRVTLPAGLATKIHTFLKGFPAGTEMTAKEIVHHIASPMSTTQGTLHRLRTKGFVMSRSRGREVLWRLPE